MGGHLDPEKVNAGTRPEIGYETRDINVVTIWKVTIIFFILTALMVVVVIPMYWFAKDQADLAAGNPKDGTHVRILPEDPYPLLQSGEGTKADIRDHRISEDAKSHGYGWSDKAKGKARIPVEEAMKEVIAKGIGGETN